MRKFGSFLLLLLIPGLTWAAITTLDPNNPGDCHKLNAPHTVLVVYATWCRYCQRFLPVVDALAELPEYQSWSFYKIADDESETVCGRMPDSFPTSYIKNIRGESFVVKGYRDEKTLREILGAADRAAAD